MRGLKIAGEILKALGPDMGRVVLLVLLITAPLYLAGTFVYQEFQVVKAESREGALYLRELNAQVMAAFQERTRADFEQAKVNAATVDAIKAVNDQMADISKEFHNLRRRYLARVGVNELDVDP